MKILKANNWVTGIVGLRAGVASIVTLLAITGCSKPIDVAEARNANGLVYKAGDREPFTGTVKNVPMYVVLQMSIQRVAIAGAAADGTCERRFADGKPDGETVCKSPSGSTLVEQNWQEGRKHGAEKIWTADGFLRSEKHWKNGKEHGLQQVYNPQTKKLVYRAEFEEGKLAGRHQLWDPSGEHLLWDLTWKDGLQTGFRKLDGAEENFVDGKPHGVQRRYRPTADSPGLRAYVEAEAMRERLGVGANFYGLYPDFVLVSEETYDRGVKVGEKQMASAQPARPATVDISSCVDMWTAAHRKEVGEEAPIRMDQVGEWEEWCKQGKRPG